MYVCMYVRVCAYVSHLVLFHVLKQWAADALVESYGISQCYDILEYYFSIAQEPSWNYFAYNAEKIINGKAEVEQDKKEREERRRLAKEWLSE